MIALTCLFTQFVESDQRSADKDKQTNELYWQRSIKIPWKDKHPNQGGVVTLTPSWKVMILLANHSNETMAQLLKCKKIIFTKSTHHTRVISQTPANSYMLIRTVNANVEEE